MATRTKIATVVLLLACICAAAASCDNCASCRNDCASECSGFGSIIFNCTQVGGILSSSCGCAGGGGGSGANALRSMFGAAACMAGALLMALA
jgi:hypothetical protein